MFRALFRFDLMTYGFLICHAFGESGVVCINAVAVVERKLGKMLNHNPMNLVRGLIPAPITFAAFLASDYGFAKRGCWS
ncbi:hypothetical protein [Novosphingobium sp. KACC 22771]|uniref:hypothetical protein n=1 Tax=Novosphingobium sp. KACC 22771 TaxID=3025670 RepID=UPI002365FBA3|nr:hypothetical protein [Novosphingobium sp. KACC 22771]WDF75216.1 hypothetical protein PQ467_19560 [Novosphingobium sp. KACC 22771]